LRFLLNNDVAATVRRVLFDAGHECWTAAEANLHDTPDDALAVYAADRSAALVSHDAEFARRRRRNTIGQHVDAVRTASQRTLSWANRLAHGDHAGDPSVRAVLGSADAVGSGLVPGRRTRDLS